MKCLVFILVIGAFATVNVKIVGGYECTPHSRPYHVALNSGYHFCDGTLINENWVVTVAHCYKSRVEVRLGEHNIRVYEGTEQFISSSRVIRHPQYSSYNMDNDIMMIKLSRPATLNEYVQPAALPTSCAPAGTMCTVSGWGNTMSSIADRDKLQCLDVRILSDRECHTCYAFSNTALCAGDSCVGGSGSPLVCNGELQGIVSVGYGCPENCPGLYTKVCMFIDWLNNTMASL